jgi:hypothetical protein
MAGNSNARGAAKVAVWLIGVFVVFWFGYAWIADYGDGVASGTYAAVVEGQTSTLLLRPDHTFHQIRVTLDSRHSVASFAAPHYSGAVH